MVRVVLFQPDIPQNTGTILRTGACLGVGIDIIEPTGFDLSAKAFKRAGLDYLSLGDWRRHASWSAYLDGRAGDAAPGRLVLLSAYADTPYTAFQFSADDQLVLGRESAGVPNDVRAACDAAITVPQVAGTRSLNVAVAAAMVLGEAMRQTR